MGDYKIHRLILKIAKSGTELLQSNYESLKVIRFILRVRYLEWSGTLQAYFL